MNYHTNYLLNATIWLPLSLSSFLLLFLFFVLLPLFLLSTGDAPSWQVGKEQEDKAGRPPRKKRFEINTFVPGTFCRGCVSPLRFFYLEEGDGEPSGERTKGGNRRWGSSSMSSI